MKTFSSLATGDHAGTANRRQPVRQTRTNSARVTATAQMPSNSHPALVDAGDTEDPGFFPAITHFTDSIAALPKELIRHYTMLKEVDAKIYGPEAELGQLLDQALVHPPSRKSISAATRESSKSATLVASDPAEHRLLFQNMRRVMSATLAILDEKNHVMNTAMDALDRQLRRCHSSYPYIEDELSEEARYGSFNHWAYTDKAGEKKSILVGERTRRSQNIQDAKEAEGAAIRSDLRREALKTSKGRNQHIDSDFDETRLPGRKGQPGPKGRRLPESGYGTNGVGLGIANAAAPPNKRRKTEKAALAALPAEKAMSSVYGSHSTVARGREPTVVEPKKKAKAALTTNGNTRRRGNTNTSGINSPLASSPIMGTFAAPGSKDRSGRSPAPAMQRMPSARARQNSAQNVATLSRNRSSSTNHKITNGSNTGGGGAAAAGGTYGTSTDIEKVFNITNRATSDVKGAAKETVNTKGENPVENVGINDASGDVRSGLQTSNKVAADRNSKREEQPEPTNGRRADRPTPVSVRGSGNGGGGGSTSKAPSANPTPRDSSFGDRARQPRAPPEQPQKRSHKKGAGLAAQLAAQAARKDDEGSSAVEDDEEGDGENEPVYCYCRGVSYGEMVGCDNKGCRREWFHLPCVGMTKPPPKTAKWYCDECKENLKKGKSNVTNGR